MQKSTPRFAFILAIFFCMSVAAQQQNLEEIIVTAQKREQSLQDTPIAISVISGELLASLNIVSLGNLTNSIVPSLNIQPYGNSPSTLVIAIRGNGPGDIGHSTRDASVAIYTDDIYLGRAQGLDFDLAELERVEVLRGPQGTLYGRNATAGAINLISKRPSGKFGVRQSIETGNYDLYNINSHVDLPRIGNVNAKIDFLYTDRSGWVDNTDESEADYNDINKKGSRLSLDWFATEDLTVMYSYHNSYSKMSHNYYQFYNDFIGVFGEERDRQSQTRQPVTTLDPTITKQNQHALTVNWTLSENVNFKSLSSYRELEDKTRNNFYGVFYFNGLVEEVDVEQEQLSQEFQFVGQHSKVDWVVGLYYFKEHVDEEIQQLFSLDIFGLINTNPLSPLDPPTNFDALATNSFLPKLLITSQMESTAFYAHATLTPPILDDKLKISLGARYTDETRDGMRAIGAVVFEIAEEHTDPEIAATYQWNDSLTTYAKWSSAFRSGGVNSRSPAPFTVGAQEIDTFTYQKEEVDTFEIGLKHEAWDRRLRSNITLFWGDIDGAFIDVFDPLVPTVNATINASKKIEVDGAEFELSIMPATGLVLGLSYTYLDGEIPQQPNLLSSTNALETFQLTQTPQHAGSFTVDYQFSVPRLGIVNIHADVVSTDQYHHFPSGGTAHPDGYTLFNARAELAQISIAGDKGFITLALWGKNLTDEEYANSSYHLEGVSTVNSFGEPRTYGVNLRYEY